MSTDDPAYVTFSVKELIAGVSEKLDRIDVKLDMKADHAIVVDLTSRVSKLETDSQIMGAKTAAALEARNKIFTRGQKIGGFVFLLFNAVLAVLAIWPAWHP